MIHMLWIVLSFFAVIGLLECIVGALELLAVRRIASVQKSVLRVELQGDEPHMEYLLNTILLMTERVNIGDVETVLEVIDVGLSPQARREAEEYCEKNPWVLFTDSHNCDKI